MAAQTLARSSAASSSLDSWLAWHCLPVPAPESDSVLRRVCAYLHDNFLKTHRLDLVSPVSAGLVNPPYAQRPHLLSDGLHQSQDPARRMTRRGLHPFSLASRRGQDKRGFRRCATHPLHVDMFCLRAHNFGGATRRSAGSQARETWNPFTS